jgi:hypothetical protein
MRPIVKDDRIYPITRIALALVDVALLVAFVVLYLFPQTTRTNFAWEIKPQIMAVFMGAGYIAGAYMFVFAIFGHQWHRVKNSLLPVSAFATVMLLITFLHYDRFIHTNLAFIAWLVIYIITPFLVPWLWYHNRVTDPGTPEPDDKVVPKTARVIAGLVGVVTILFWLVNFINPPWLISFWPWKLTPLTARVLCAWGTIIAVGGLVQFRDSRWSTWRLTTQSIALWQALMVIGSIVHRQDFNNGSLLNPYFIGIIIILFLSAILYVWMEYGVTAQKTIPETTEVTG